MAWPLDLLDTTLAWATDALTDLDCAPNNPTISHCRPLGCCVDLRVYLDPLSVFDPNANPFDTSSCCAAVEYWRLWVEYLRPWCAHVRLDRNPTAEEYTAATNDVLGCFDDFRCAWRKALQSGLILPTKDGGSCVSPDAIFWQPPEMLCPDGCGEAESGVAAGWRVGALIRYGARRPV